MDDDPMVTQFHINFFKLVARFLVVAILMFSSCLSPLIAQPIVPLERWFEGEASYELMKKHWRPAGGEWTALSPKNACTKFRVNARGIRTYVKVWPPDPGHKDLEEFYDHTMLSPSM